MLTNTAQLSTVTVTATVAVPDYQMKLALDYIGIRQTNENARNENKRLVQVENLQVN